MKRLYRRQLRALTCRRDFFCSVEESNLVPCVCTTHVRVPSLPTNPPTVPRWKVDARIHTQPKEMLQRRHIHLQRLRTLAKGSRVLRPRRASGHTDERSRWTYVDSQAVREGAQALDTASHDVEARARVAFHSNQAVLAIRVQTLCVPQTKTAEVQVTKRVDWSSRRWSHILRMAAIQHVCRQTTNANTPFLGQIRTYANVTGAVTYVLW